MMDKKTKPKLNIKSFEEINRSWETIKSLSVREKLSALKSLGFDIKVIYKPGETALNEIQRYIELLKEIIRIPNRPASLVLLLNRMYADWLALTGNSEHLILQKKSAKLNIQSGQIVMADQTLDLSLLAECDEKIELQLINKGNLFAFNTGGDGIINVQCRVVEANNPVLTLKEYKCSVNATEMAVIKIPTGLLQIACS